MRFVFARSGQFPLYDQNSPCAGELRRRSLASRSHACLLMWGRSHCLASSARTSGPWDAAGGVAEPAVKASWSAATRSHSAFAVSPLDPSEKRETYTILRHPEGGRKAIFRWAGKDQTLGRAGNLSGRWGIRPPSPGSRRSRRTDDTGWAFRTGAGGPRRQQVRHGDAASPRPRQRRGTIMPWLHQALRGAGHTVPAGRAGQRLAGTARGDCLHVEPADPADFRK